MNEVVPGPKNLITDVAGIKVGNAEDGHAISGVTAIIPDAPVVAGVDVRGGAPGTRDVEALDPTCIVEHIHGIVLSGGSVFGLAAASGVVETLAAQGTGFTFGGQPLPCPVVPSAILFDLMNGGDKSWAENPPYRALGKAACQAASGDFALGNAGAGLGAVAGRLKGGLGSASCTWGEFTIGALVAVNSAGSVIDPASGRLWASPFELSGEFGVSSRPTLRLGGNARPPLLATVLEGNPAADQAGTNTTIAVIATDAELSRSEAKRVAIMAADGMARAIRPIHTPYDGDTVFALATCKKPLGEKRPLDLAAIGTLAADTLTRAIGRAVCEARSIPGQVCLKDA